MDVRIRPPLALGISLLALALAGCSSTPTPKEPTVHPGLAVFDNAIALPANPHSIVREGDRVTYLVTSPDGEHLLARFDASCTQPVGSMYYPTARGLAAFAERGAEENSLPDAQLQQLHHSAQLQQACAQRATPDWRALAQADGQDWLMLDHNSLQRENGLLSVWVGHNPLHLSFTPNGAALVGHTRERLVMDCAQQTLMMASQFNLITNGAVYGGRLEPKATQQPLSAATPDQQRVFKAACLPAAELAKLPAAQERQPLPPLFDTPVAEPEVLAAIEALALPKPSRTLRQVNLRYTVRLFNGMDAEDLPQDHFLSTDATSGQLLVQTLDPITNPASVHLSFQGLFDLASRSRNRKSGQEEANSPALIGLSFTGDWINVPSSSEISYTRTFRKTPAADSDATSNANTVTCQVGLEQAASRLHPALKGTAKPLTCIRLKSRLMTWVEEHWYLSDYRLFIKTSDNGPMGRWDWQIESVE